MTLQSATHNGHRPGGASARVTGSAQPLATVTSITPNAPTRRQSCPHPRGHCYRCDRDRLPPVRRIIAAAQQAGGA